VVAPALARGESWKGVLEVFDTNGRRFPLWERADTLRNADGEMLFASGFMNDIIILHDMEGRIVEVVDHREQLARGHLDSQMYRRQYELVAASD
jgi:hypothetical protein